MMKKTLLAVVILLSLATMTVGGAVAGFSDTDTSKDNVFETASLDLLVAKENGTFREDQPWGVGLEPVFYIDCAEICETYVTNLFLWNIGSTDGSARLHIRLTEDTASIADTTTLRVLYDTDGDTVLEEITFTTLQSLSSPFTLGPLPADEIRQLRLEIHPKVGEGENTVPFELEFSTEFQLVQVGHSYSDTETSLSHLESCGEGCTPGAWKNRLLDIGEWGPTGYSPDDKLGVGPNHPFEFPNISDYAQLKNKTLLEALDFPGGDILTEKAQILLRAAVAALLNAAHPDVNYPMSAGDVIAEVNAALASGDPATMLDLATILDGYNNLGSPF